MLMKISLARGPRGPVSTQTAWGCLTSNLALPGSGSLLAGRASGYGQLLLSLIGMSLTLLFGMRYLIWQTSNWSRLQAEVDPLSALQEMWIHLRWAALGIGMFLVSVVWAFVSSLAILASSRQAERINQPPRLL
jgi:heme/copper-type cytochrome/quinol oxidase subunit 3